MLMDIKICTERKPEKCSDLKRCHNKNIILKTKTIFMTIMYHITFKNFLQLCFHKMFLI